ncbi:unnamed protein product [Clonostachys chloroleuca]|uniref:Uncharacterized protein n=1 Tax=Clonostachys chloroleuca TaxID=1926264 RepID=A0AA35LZ64_9HYPO|nr:unnamed protein product [Clonostachys chloroleuca]
MGNEVNGSADERITPWLCLASGAVWRDPVRAGHTQATGNFIAREFTDDYQPALGLHVIGPGLYSAAVGAAGAAGAGCPLLG